MSRKRFHGKRVIVTGGSDGLGLAMAKAFAREGAALWLVARNQEKLSEAKEELFTPGVEVRVSSCDLADQRSVRKLGTEVGATWERLDVLVNNAGIARFTPLADVTSEEIVAQVNVNLIAPYLLTQSLIEPLTVAQGSVINISSSSAQRLIPGRPASVYAMTKGGLNTLTKALALELGHTGVRINAIAPGTVRTVLTEKMIAAFSPERRAEYERFVSQVFALGRIGTPEEVSGMALFLASDEARWMTGAVVNVDGGLTTN